MRSYFSEALALAPLTGDWLEAEEDRRSAPRAATVYRPCCVRNGARSSAGLIRNISAGGLMIETRLAASVGSIIEYVDGVSNWRRARVTWTGPNRLGLVHVAEEKLQPGYPARPVRIPAKLSARIWLDDGPVDIGVGNVSQTGLFVFGVPRLHIGRLRTVTINGRDFPQTSVRWWAEGCAGLRLHRPIPMGQLSALIDTVAA